MTRRHMVPMLLCCLIPIAAVVLALAFGATLQTGLLVGLLLLCPVLHLGLMRSMGHDHAGHAASSPSSDTVPGDR